MQATEYYSEKFPIIYKMINTLIDYGDKNGGIFHFVIVDNNFRDEDLDCAIDLALKEENKDRIETELGLAICKMLKSLTLLQRAVLFDVFEREIDFSYLQDFVDFDYVFDWDDEYLNQLLEKATKCN